jgi:hypothetical protein
MALQDMIRWLIPREDQFFGFLEKQASAARRGALALAQFGGGASIEEVQAAVQAVEHEGDKLVHELEEALDKTFVTPIDREDLRHLAAELDDVLDLTNSAARACALFGVQAPTPPMKALIGVLEQCATQLEEAVPKLGKRDYPGIMAASRSIRQLEKEGDTAFRAELSRLFHDESVDAKQILREKEVLENLEHAIDRCERVAHTLANLAVKHG